MAATNGLEIYPHDPELELTELEGNLIAKRIVFMKIIQLPKSRWTALKDNVINVPVQEDDIVNTISNLPRTFTCFLARRAVTSMLLPYPNDHLTMFLQVVSNIN